MRFQDRLLRWGLTGLAALILALLAYFFIRLYVEAKEYLKVRAQRKRFVKSQATA